MKQQRVLLAPDVMDAAAPVDPPPMTTDDLARLVGAGAPPPTSTMPPDTGDVDLDDVPEEGRPYIPQRTYAVVIIGAEFSRSKSSGQPMITFTWEIVDPKIVVFKNNAVNVEGTKIIEYASLQPQALGKLKSLHKFLGLPAKISTSNPLTNVYMGKAVYAIVNTRSKVLTIEGTNEPILNAEKQPVAQNDYKIERYIGAAPNFNREIPY